jgi:hypothetical protein
MNHQHMTISHCPIGNLPNCSFEKEEDPDINHTYEYWPMDQILLVGLFN